MKKLVTYNGGHPFKLDDLLHVQDGINEAIICLMKALLSNGTNVPNCKLYGCVVTVPFPAQPIVNISAGAVVLNGEICMFGGINNLDLDAIVPDQYVFATTDTYPASNPVVYKPPTPPKNVHLNRICQIMQINGAPSVSQAPLNVKSFNEIMKLNLFPDVNNTGWHYVGDVNEPQFANSFSNGFTNSNQESVRYRKDNITCILSGTIDYSPLSNLQSINMELNMFVLPVGFRPDLLRVVSVRSNTPAGWATFAIKIYPNGNVSLTCTQMDAGMTVADLYVFQGGTDWTEVVFALA